MGFSTSLIEDYLGTYYLIYLHTSRDTATDVKYLKYYSIYPSFIKLFHSNTHILTIYTDFNSLSQHHNTSYASISQNHCIINLPV